MVSTFVIVTLAPETTAPEASVTIPTILPVATVVWPKPRDDSNPKRATNAQTTETRTANREQLGINMFCLPFIIIDEFFSGPEIVLAANNKQITTNNKLMEFNRACQSVKLSIHDNAIQ